MLPVSSAAKWLRTKWLGSKSPRGMWGRIINSPSPKRWSSRPERLLSIERLEDRTMLSVSLTVTGSDVKFYSPLVTDDLFVQTLANGGSPKVQWTTDLVNWQDVSGLTLASAGSANIFTFQMSGKVHLYNFTGSGGSVTFQGAGGEEE